MYTSPTMSFGDSIVISLLGIMIVFAVLIVLALAVKVVSNLVAGFSANTQAAKPAQKAAAAPKAAPVDDTENEMQAAVIAALCEELHTTPDRLTVNYIKAI